jgi:hypothetical protein
MPMALGMETAEPGGFRLTRTSPIPLHLHSQFLKSGRYFLIFGLHFLHVGRFFQLSFFAMAVFRLALLSVAFFPIPFLPFTIQNLVLIMDVF